MFQIKRNIKFLFKNCKKYIIKLWYVDKSKYTFVSKKPCIIFIVNLKNNV